jgi:hypothetical protein
MVQRQQLNALLRKSVAYQRKNWAQNCCVIDQPVVGPARFQGTRLEHFFAALLAIDTKQMAELGNQ